MLTLPMPHLSPVDGADVHSLILPALGTNRYNLWLKCEAGSQNTVGRTNMPWSPSESGTVSHHSETTAVPTARVP